MKFKNILGKGERVSIEKITSDFVSLASHQLRTPLSAIKWNMELLMSQKTGKLSPKQMEYLKEIYRSNERAINLVNDLLDVSRIQEGQIHLELRPAKVEEVVEGAINDLETLIKASDVTLDLQIIGGPLPKMEIDQEKLRRVTANLVSNAVKYTPARGKIKIGIKKYKKHVTVSVTDSGVGISKEDRVKIFQKFFRSPRILKLAPDGTGLGLFISKSLVDAMGGKISFTSNEGKGTTFYFTIPIKI